ncbi:MAG: DUF3179 domain-containing protein [Thalassobaculaceae bacterium]|nr:DUF3179 domain-containing protein [Thalassobaculaceae bacterium]
MLRIRALLAIAWLLLAATTPAHAQNVLDELGDDRTSQLHALAVFAPADVRRAAMAEIVQSGDPSAIATLILALRYRQEGQVDTIHAFQALSGSDAEIWFDTMLWQERHPEVVPHPSYRLIKLALFERIDPAFLRFLGGARGRPENLDIRLEEIVWGGVKVDGIPALDNPTLVAADSEEAGYLLDDDLVFGVEINGDARAYPLRILGWHEMVNDVIGGVPVALAYCTLCGAGILYETAVEGRTAPFVFGSSGFLYRSNKLMFDRQTDSLWNQFTGEPVSGPLRGSGIALQIHPVAIASWIDWHRANPTTRVLARDTGYRRNYEPGVVYRDYFASPDLMFPAVTEAESGLAPKDHVFGIRTAGGAKAWPLAAFATEPVINDSVGFEQVVLVGDAANRTVRAYHRDGRSFAATGDPGVLRDDAGDWRIGEAELSGPDGARLPRIAGHVAYWFAWNSYLGDGSAVYGVSD